MEENVGKKDGYIERVIPGEPGMENLYQTSLAKYRLASEYVGGKVVLDAGCGCGHGSALLKKKGAKKVFGVDLFPETIDFAKRRYKANGIEFLVMDCNDLSFQNGCFDVVVSFEVIEHIKNTAKYLSEVKRVIRKGGVFVLSTPNKKFSSVGEPNPFHVKEFNHDKLRGVLENYFPDVAILGLKIVHQKAIRYEKSSQNLQKLSRWSQQLSLISRLIPKVIRNMIFNTLTVEFPILGPEDIKISPETPEESRVLIGVCRL